MKLLFNILAAFLLIFIFSVPSMAQNDSVKVEYSEENPEKSDFKIKEKYKYLRKNKVEEKSLFKIAVVDANFGINNQVFVFFDHHERGRLLAYERKLSPSFSAIVYNVNYFGLGILHQTPLDSTKLFNTTGIGARYYHSQRRRIAEGKTANNFSDNYFAFQVNNLLIIKYNFPKAHYPKQLSLPTVDLLYGIQRRLGKFGYFDWNFGIRYDQINYVKKQHKLPFDLTSNFSIGLGF
ncbi:MAG TPA: hypothetical protein VNW99_02315 [Cytophagaceae bacterium]|nr:hypothetical protein [Cytophagaceae bacterium]